MLILSHRGLRRGVPENTLGAFQAAVDAGVDGIETDLRRTRDDAIVLFHDRLDPRGLAVGDLTHRELSDAVGYAVPTVDDALTTWPDLLWNLEIKTPDVAAPLRARLRAHEGVHVLVTSFWHDALAAFADAGRHVECGALLASCPIELSPGLRSMAHVRTLVWEYEFIAAQTLRLARAHDMRVFAYDAQTRTEHEACRRAGLDGLITDEPGLARPHTGAPDA